MKTACIATILALTVGCSSKKDQPDTPPAPKTNDEAPADKTPAAEPAERPADTRAPGTTVEAGKSLVFMDQGGDPPVDGPIRWEANGRVAILEYKPEGDDGAGNLHVIVDGKEVAKLDVGINLAFSFNGSVRHLASGDLLVSAHDSGGGQDEGTAYRYLLTWDGASVRIAKEWSGTGLEEVPAWGVEPTP